MFRFMWWGVVLAVLFINMYVLEAVRKVDQKLRLVLGDDS